MSTAADFQPLDPAITPRFAGVATFMRTVIHPVSEAVDVGLIGVPFDLGLNGTTSNPDLLSADELRSFERLKPKVRWCIYGGSCLAYAQIASGRIDVGIDGGFDPFDYCALAPVIAGAGGIVTDWEGPPLSLHSGSRILAAGDPAVHSEALRILAQA